MEYNYQDNKPIVRIKQIRLRDFKNIKDSRCQIVTSKQDNREEGASILGLYGQNGSGKTAIIEAIHILKYVMSGKPVPARFADCISVNAGKSNLEFTFSLQDPNRPEQVRTIVYSFDLLADTASSEVQNAELPEGKLVRVCNEIVSFGGSINSKTIKLQPVIRTDTSQEPIGPARKLSSLLGKTNRKGKLHRLAAIKQEAFSESRSFIFSSDTTILMMRDVLISSSIDPEIIQAVLEQVFGENDAESTRADAEVLSFVEEFLENGSSAVKNMSTADFKKLIEKLSSNSSGQASLDRFEAFYQGRINIFMPDENTKSTEEPQQEEEPLGWTVWSSIQKLVLFASTSLYVVDTRTDGSIRLKQKLPFMTRERTFEIPLDGSFSIPEDTAKKLVNYISGVNGVLKQLIPGLEIALREEDHTGHSRTVSLYASRNDNLYPLRFESDGVIRLISLLWLLIPAYNDRTFALVVDEIDAGIYEYLLGDILKAFEEYGKGQLVFTSHNLRPLEVISKDSIVFTTTNPENRYIRLKRIGQTNNLRDVYLREIRMQESEEELYKTGKRYEILSSIRNASIGFVP